MPWIITRSQIRLGATEDWSKVKVKIPGGATGVSVTANVQNTKTGAYIVTLLNGVSVNFVAGVAQSLKDMGAAEWTPALPYDAALNISLTSGTPSIPAAYGQFVMLISVTQYPTPANTLVGASTDGQTGLFDEAARNNATAGAGDIAVGKSIKIQNVTTNGAFDESARNVSAGAGNILLGVHEKIQNVDIVGVVDEYADELAFEAARNTRLATCVVLSGQDIFQFGAHTTGTANPGSTPPGPARIIAIVPGDTKVTITGVGDAGVANEIWRSADRGVTWTKGVTLTGDAVTGIFSGEQTGLTNGINYLIQARPGV